jgi:4-aminobutyrate aminotransferase/(S)-3-amino-2-methylpropionate transaminase
LACAAALAVLDVIEKEALCERANAVGVALKAGLAKLQAEYPDRIGDIRGKGAMVAMELIKNGDAGQPDPELTKTLSVKAAESGLIIISCGVRGNVIRMLTPLTIPMDQLEEGLGILANSFRDCV